jgi:glucose-6-phosphate-specific signal transduction histidine kinase
VVAEALTNAARHAHASAVSVQADLVGSALRITVRDDGAGGAGFSGGTGLAGLKDRVEALGGLLVLHSPPGAGTSLHVELPVTPGASVRRLPGFGGSAAAGAKPRTPRAGHGTSSHGPRVP